MVARVRRGRCKLPDLVMNVADAYPRPASGPTRGYSQGQGQHEAIVKVSLGFLIHLGSCVCNSLRHLPPWSNGKVIVMVRVRVRFRVWLEFGFGF